MFGSYLPEIMLTALLPVLLVASGFFSGCETAWFSFSSHQQLQLSRSGTLAGSIAVRLADEKRRLLITLMLGNMLTNVSFFVVSTILLLKLRQRQAVATWGLWMLNVLPLLLLILFGEVLPKLVASTRTLQWVRLAAVPLLLIHRLLAPLRLICAAGVIAPLARLLAPPRRPPELSAEELETVLELSQQRGIIDHEEEQLLQQVLELGQLKVSDLMTPRVDIKAFDLDDDPAKLLELIRQTRLTQIPVHRGDLDHMEGLIHSRQALIQRPQSVDQVRALIRQIKFVPEQQRADQLLEDLRKSSVSVAMVVDEYGGTAGLITLEAVVEHMVGQIAGPFESTSSPQVEAIGAGQWRADAELPVRDWAEAFGFRWPAQEGPGAAEQGLRTLGGLVMARLGRVAAVGDRTSVGNISFEVETMKSRRIRSLLISLNRTQTDPGAA